MVVPTRTVVAQHNQVGNDEEFKTVPPRVRRRCKSVQNRVLQTQEMTVEKFLQAAIDRGVP